MIQVSTKPYDEFIYQSTKNNILNNKAMVNDNQLILLDENRKLNESRNKYFRTKLTSGYVLKLLESYVLPLLFGSFGAFTLVLRSIYNDFKNTSFTVNGCMDYNLRIVLGGVTGISCGVFFSDSGAFVGDQFSPMMVAFLIGYNVDILFSAMDASMQRLLPQKSSDS